MRSASNAPGVASATRVESGFARPRNGTAFDRKVVRRWTADEREKYCADGLDAGMRLEPRLQLVEELLHARRTTSRSGGQPDDRLGDTLGFEAERHALKPDETLHEQQRRNADRDANRDSDTTSTRCVRSPSD